LRLHNKNDCIQRTFSPKNQDRSYQAACWIRYRNSTSISDFKAIIKTNKEDIIGILPANLLIHRGEWYYFEININLPEIRKHGALTPIYSTNILGKFHCFQEDTIKIQEQQDHGFVLLGLTRSKATEQLLANVHNVEIRSLIAPEIELAFRRYSLPTTMKNKSNYQRIDEKFKQHNEKIKKHVCQINEILGLKDHQQLDFINLF
jgi:hypothetical protein